MKTKKSFLLIFGLMIFHFGVIKAQNINCDTDFFTITVNGDIQKWSLNNSTISGGDTILRGGGTSLSYCGDVNNPTFFSNSYSTIGITYYDTTNGWVNIPTSAVVDNGGGYLNDQYNMTEGAVIQIINYFDGISLSTVDTLSGEFFAGTFDIAVDTFGQAWIFTGALPNAVDSLKVYNKYGRTDAYSINYDFNAYGSFFLNNILYIGSMQDSIYPVIINGSSAQLGNPILFPSNNFTDMASCQKTNPSNSINENVIEAYKIYPNPSSGYIVLPDYTNASEILIFNALGEEIESIINDGVLNLSRQKNGVYFIKIISGEFRKTYKIIIEK